MASNRFEEQAELQIKLMGAARALKEFTGDTHVQFANRLNRSISAVHRMVNEKFPLRDLRTLTQMAAIAVQVGREDLAEIFREQLLIAGGADLLPEQPAEAEDSPEVARAIRKLRYIYGHASDKLQRHLEESMSLIESHTRMEERSKKR